MKKLWLVSLPYAAWWLMYKHSEQGRAERRTEELDRQVLIGLANVGISPELVVVVWHLLSQKSLKMSQLLVKSQPYRDQNPMVRLVCPSVSKVFFANVDND